MKINRKCNKADLDFDLIANVDKIREAYMKFACLPDSERNLVIESSVDQTPLWHLASACRKALAAIVGDEDLGEVIYNEMGDIGESAAWNIEYNWTIMLYRAASMKQYRRRIAQYN